MEEQKTTTFGKVLKQERERLGLTQTQLADRLSTTQQNIGHWETGRSMPKHDAFERLLQVFGADSLLSHLPPRGQINVELQQFRKNRELMVDVVDKDGKESKLDAVQVWADGHLQSVKGAQLSKDIIPLLPAELRANTERKMEMHGFVYRPDYLSEKLCAECRYVSGNRVDMVARMGMQQLLLFKKLITDSGRPEPLLLLALASGDMLTVISGASMKMHAEAKALGIKLVYANSSNAVAHTIEQMEFGREPDQEEEEDY